MQIELTDRELSIIKFALYRFTNAANDQAAFFARKETANHEKHLAMCRDAEDSAALLLRLRAIGSEDKLTAPRARV